MKKAITLLLFLGVLFSCNTPKTVIESRKVIKGNWTLDDVSYDRSGTFNIRLLQDTSMQCFEGSSWRFIPNNNTGSYSIDNGDCPTGERFFIFDIQEMNPESGLYDFLLKPTDEKKRSEDNKGFRLRLAQLSENSMRWEQTVSLEGAPFTITMQFSKSE